MTQISRRTFEYLTKSTCDKLGMDSIKAFNYNAACAGSLSNFNEYFDKHETDFVNSISLQQYFDPQLVRHCKDYRQFLLDHKLYIFDVLLDAISTAVEEEQRESMDYAYQVYRHSMIILVYLSHHQCKHAFPPIVKVKHHPDLDGECVDFFIHTLPVISKMNEFYYDFHRHYSTKHHLLERHQFLAMMRNFNAFLNIEYHSNVLFGRMTETHELLKILCNGKTINVII